MATEDTKLIISIETILRGLDKTLRGLAQVEKQLKAVANIKIGGTQNFDKAAAAAQRLRIQEQRLALQSQNLQNAQLRGQVIATRLAAAQERLAQSTARAAATAQRAGRSQVNEERKRAREIERINRQTEIQAARQTAIRERAARSLSDVQQREARAGANSFLNVLGQQSAAADALNKRMLALGNSLRSVGQGLAQVGLTLSVTLTAPIIALGTASVTAAVQLDSLTRGLTAIVGSSVEAGRQLARLEQIAKLPGIGFEEAIQGSIRLQAVGFSAAEAEKNLREFANAIALTGGGREELSRVTVQLGQLAAKGKVLSQDLRPIIEAAPAVGRALLEAFGTVNAADIEELGLSTKEFLGILTDQLGQLPRAAAGAKNSFENFRDTVFRAGAAIGEALLPPLLRLVEVAGPIITQLAEGFRSLPAPLQNAIIALSGILAALGPLAFVVGQLTTGVGRLIVGFAQLNQLGLVPAIRSMVALTATATTAAEAELALAAASRTATAALVGIGIVLAAITAAYLIYNAQTEEAVKVTADQVKVADDQVSALEKQLEFLGGLQEGVKRTADEQERLAEVYGQLNSVAQARIGGITAERDNLKGLREEVERLLKLRQQERDLQAAQLAADLANAAATVNANERRIESISEQVKANAELREEIARTGTVTDAQRESLKEQNILGESASQIAERLAASNQTLLDRQRELRAESDALTKSGKEQAQALATLEQRGQGTARQFLEIAKAAGIFKGNIDEAIQSMERLGLVADRNTPKLDAFTRSLRAQNEELLKAGERARETAKADKDLIDAAVAVADGATDSLEGAIKTIEAFMRANSELTRAITAEAKKQGKSIRQFLTEELQKGLGTKRAGSGAGLRTAQLELAKAQEAVIRAGLEKQNAITIAGNETLQQTIDTAFRLQLISYREYLNTRAALLKQNLEFEIDEQAKAAADARLQAARALKSAGAAGVSATESTRRQQQAAEAERRAIAAETKLVELVGRRDRITDEVTQSLREQAREQEDSIRESEIAFAQLQGNLEDALDAELVDKFRNRLKELTNEQLEINRILKARKDILTAEEKEELNQARARNQREIELIRNRERLERANNAIEVSENRISRAKETQSILERELANQVDFRGLKEEEAIALRLQGEERVKAALAQERDFILSILKALEDVGIRAPQTVLDRVREINTEIQSLGRLSFSEQFRLAEKEFSRTQDQLSNSIQDIERRIQSRDLSEIQGRKIIRELNAEYIQQLEREVVLLEQIAAESNDEALRRQAEQARQNVEDIRAAADELKNFNTQLKSVAIDAFADSLSTLFTDLADNTESAAEDIKNFFRNILNTVNQFVAQDLARRITESLFPSGDILGGIKGIFGGGGAAVGSVGAAAGASAPVQAAAAALATAGTTAAAALTTGAATAAATEATSATAAAAGFSTAVVAAAAGFSTAVVAAASAFAAIVASAAAASAGASAIGGAGSSLAGAFGAASGAVVPAQPGGRLIRVAEGGFPEAVLTTDPKFATRQIGILRQYLKHTRGLFGRIPEFAQGGIVGAREAELDLLNSISRTPSFASTVSSELVSPSPSGASVSFRNINLFDRKEMVRGYLRSAEGTTDILNTISENSADIGRRIGIR